MRPRVGAGAVKLRLAWVDRKASRYACERWHYSGSLPASKTMDIGVWEDDRFIGVVLFSRGATPALGKPFGLRQTECCELTRVALTKHETPVTRIISIAIRMLRKASPGLRLIVSYADPHQGHHGGIYQAGGWIYTGDTAPVWIYVHKRTGREYHSRVVHERGYVRGLGGWQKGVKPSECDRERRPGKHRYIMPLDKRTRRRVEHMARDYPPARDRSTDGGATTYPVAGGGSTPTRSLPSE